MIKEANGIKVDSESGLVQMADNCNIGILDNYYPQDSLSLEIVTSRFTNIRYFSTSHRVMIVCVDSYSRQIHAGKGEEVDKDARVILIKSLASSAGWEYATGDKIIFFSVRENSGKVLSGKFIGYRDELIKRVSIGRREVRVIEARDGEQRLTGILMFAPGGEVLYYGACVSYMGGKKSQFIIRTGKKHKMYIKV